MNATFKAGLAASALCALFAFACSTTTQRSGFGEDTDPNLPDGGAGNGTFGSDEAGPAGECAVNVTSGDLDKDYDGDGFPLKYDCNECNPSINKGAYDIPGNGIDDDCNGNVDDQDLDDGNIDLDTKDPFDGAKAIGLRKAPDDKSWGVIDAKWVRADGTTPLDKPLSYGVLPEFGTNAPQAGNAMLALSSGFARAPGQPGFKSGVSQEKGYQSKPPKGYPKNAANCGSSSPGDPAYDGAALSVTIRVPANAKSFSFQQFFFTHEYPGYVCNRFNDFYVAMMSPAPSSLPDGNIAFDQDTNAISVNNSFLQACVPGEFGPFLGPKKKFTCPLGTDPLKGTGFDDAGGTGWLTTTAPVTPGSEITLVFTVWDAGDTRYDSTVLIDDFKFLGDGAATTQTKPSDPK